MEKIRVRIVTASQLVGREVDFFCLEELSKVFDLEYWDCSAFLFPNFQVPNKVLQKPYLRVIRSIKDFESQIKQLPYDTVFVVDVFANQRNFLFYKVLCRYFPSYLTVFFSTNTVIPKKEDIDDCNVQKTQSVVQSFKNLLYRSFLIKRIVTILHYFGSNNYRKKMDYLYASEIQKMSNLTIIASMKGFDKRINHPDYEKYLKIKDDERVVKEKYIVFVDEYFPYLKEVVMGDPNINLEEAASLYYESMNHFFEGIENEYGYKVVIAAHPRSNYEKKNPFGGRELYYYKTANLIKDSEAVCIHNSNCYSYVALFDKPIAAIINKGWRMSSLFTKYVEDVNENLSIPLVDLDIQRNSYKNIFINMDPNVREYYIDTYLCDTKLSTTNTALFTSYYKNHYHKLKCV